MSDTADSSIRPGWVLLDNLKKPSRSGSKGKRSPIRSHERSPRTNQRSVVLYKAARSWQAALAKVVSNGSWIRLANPQSIISVAMPTVIAAKPSTMTKAIAAISSSHRQGSLAISAPVRGSSGRSSECFGAGYLLRRWRARVGNLERNERSREAGPQVTFLKAEPRPARLEVADWQGTEERLLPTQ
jgi:hypothetical protein